MTDLWYRKLGFGRNPFTIKPAAYSYELVGVNTDEVLSGIDGGKILFVEAPLGFGKTTILKSIIHRYGGKRKVIYAHTLPTEKLDVKALLKHSSLSTIITGSLPTGMILVIDEAQHILPESTAEVMEFYKSGNIRAVVMFGTECVKERMTDDMKSAMNGSLIRLTKPTQEQAILLIRSRIGNLPLLSNDSILTAYKKAQGSPRKLLQLCEDACRSAIESGRTTVASDDFSATMSIPDEPTITSEQPKKENVRPKTVKKAKPAIAKKKPMLEAKHDLVEPTKPTATAALSIAPLAAEVSAKPLIASHHAIQKKTAPRQRPKAVVTPKKAKQAAPKKKEKPKEAKHKAPVRYTMNRNSAKPTKAPGAAAKITTSQADPAEGSYWGEFMGMQK